MNYAGQIAGRSRRWTPAGDLAIRATTAWRRLEEFARPAGLLLPGALLVTMGAELLAPFVFIDFCFAPFFQ